MTPETETQTETETDDELTWCETCGCELTAVEIDYYGDECAACHMKAHFTCKACDGECEFDDQHSEYRTLCQSCGDAKEEEILDAAKEELREMIEEICESDDLALIKRNLRALRSR